MSHENRLIRLAEVLAIVPFSRSHIYRLEKSGDFPRRIKLGIRRIAWRSTEISEWIAGRADHHRKGVSHE